MKYAICILFATISSAVAVYSGSSLFQDSDTPSLNTEHTVYQGYRGGKLEYNDFLSNLCKETMKVLTRWASNSTAEEFQQKLKDTCQHNPILQDKCKLLTEHYTAIYNLLKYGIAGEICNLFKFSEEDPLNITVNMGLTVDLVVSHFDDSHTDNNAQHQFKYAPSAAKPQISGHVVKDTLFPGHRYAENPNPLSDINSNLWPGDVSSETYDWIDSSFLPQWQSPQPFPPTINPELRSEDLSSNKYDSMNPSFYPQQQEVDPFSSLFPSLRNFNTEKN